VTEPSHPARRAQSEKKPLIADYGEGGANGDGQKKIRKGSGGRPVSFGVLIKEVTIRINA